MRRQMQRLHLNGDVDDQGGDADDSGEHEDDGGGEDANEQRAA
jgi:hypothetical protein